MPRNKQAAVFLGYGTVSAEHAMPVRWKVVVAV